eukprot:1884532-Amphidinium_carterae.1
MLSESNWKYLHGERVEDCGLSDEECSSRRRVITSAHDPRLIEPRFKTVKVIVANNDVKYLVPDQQGKGNGLRSSVWGTLAMVYRRRCGWCGRSAEC